MRTESWRHNAVNWIHRHASELPDAPISRWHVAKPSLAARVEAIHILRYVPEDFIPVELGITLNCGIELDWQRGRKKLEIEIRSDGTLEILQCVADETVNTRIFPATNWRLGEAFVWLESP